MGSEITLEITLADQEWANRQARDLLAGASTLGEVFSAAYQRPHGLEALVVVLDRLLRGLVDAEPALGPILTAALDRPRLAIVP